MFTIPRVNVIESDEGFSIELLGQTGLKYQEKDQSLFVDSEILNGPSGLIIYTDSIDHWSPSNTQVTEPERTRIVENIRRAFKFRGFDIEIA
jgi:hypothetical protein